MNHFAAGLGRRNCGVGLRILFDQRTVKIGYVESHDDIRLGDQILIFSREVERMRVGEV